MKTAQECLEAIAAGQNPDEVLNELLAGALVGGAVGWMKGKHEVYKKGLTGKDNKKARKDVMRSNMWGGAAIGAGAETALNLTGATRQPRPAVKWNNHNVYEPGTM